MGINLAGPINVDQFQNIINQGFLDWRKLLGPEKVTNGTFTGAATGWTLNTGWTYNANAVDRDGAGTATMEQNVSAVVGEIYRVEYQISAYTDGSVTVSIGGTSGTSRSSAATFVEYLKAATTGNLIFTPVANATFTIDNVSVKKVGYVAADGVTAWIEDRGATAGKGALHLVTEDGTGHVFGDRVGIGTLYPSAAFNVAVASTFDANISLGANSLIFTDILFKRVDANYIGVYDSDGTTYHRVRASQFRADVFGPNSAGDTPAFYLGESDGEAGLFYAHDTGGIDVEIARGQGAADPYWQIGRDDTGVSLNTVTDMLVLRAGGGSGNEAASFGLGVAANLGNAASEVEKRGYINWVLTIATNGSERTRLDFGTMTGGALINPFQLGAGGPIIPANFTLYMNGGNIDFESTNTGIRTIASNTGILDQFARNAAEATQSVIKLIAAATITNGIGALYAGAVVPTTDGAGNTAILPASFLYFKFNAGGTLVAYVNDAGTIKSLSLGTPA